jgi:hypothetical protein
MNTSTYQQLIDSKTYYEALLKRLDKPEMGRDVFIGFSCLDSKSDR